MPDGVGPAGDRGIPAVELAERGALAIDSDAELSFVLARLLDPDEGRCVDALAATSM